MSSRRADSTQALDLGAIALGTMYFGSTLPAPESTALLDEFVDGGGSVIDTANNYPCWVTGMTGDESETFVGAWLAARGHPDGLVIATKIGARPTAGSSGFDAPQGLSGAAVARQVDESLARLGIERIDLLYAHIDDAATPLAETLGALDDVVRAGKARAIGCSNLALDRLEEAHQISDENGWARYCATQMRHTYLTASPDAKFWPQVVLEDDLAEYAANQQMAVLAYSTLLGGAYVRSDRPVPTEYHHKATGVQLEAVRSTAHRLGATPNQVVLAFLMQALPTSIPVIGVSTHEQLREAMTAGAVELDDQALATLRTARGLHRT